MKFRCWFNGRRVGAIGITYACCVDVEHPTADAESIRLKVYETHDHISGLRILQVDPPIKEFGIRNVILEEKE